MILQDIFQILGAALNFFKHPLSVLILCYTFTSIFFVHISFLNILLSSQCITCQKWHWQSIATTRIQIPSYYLYPSVFPNM